MLSKIHKLGRWLISLDSRHLRLGFGVVVGIFAFLFSVYYGFSVGLFLLLSCLVAFKLPVLIIYFNELFIGDFSDYSTVTDSVNNPKIVSTDKPLPPYFLLEGDLVSPDVDHALEKFLDGVLEKFVVKWQSSFEIREEHFVVELRHILKFIIVRLYKLVEKVDLSRFIIDKVVPTCMWHLECYSTGYDEGNNAKELEMRVLSCFGTHLHPAMESRKAEETYLRQCAEHILRQLLIPAQLKSSKLLNVLFREILSCQILQHTMDSLGDPDNVNLFIVLWLGEGTAPTTPISPNDHDVPMLKNFTHHCPPKPFQTCLHPSLSSILKNPPHLYWLMQFLKREGSLKYLQFSFAVDEFNEKLLNPDLTLEQKKRLQFMGQKMYEIYFSHKSPDHIDFGHESLDRMEKIVLGKAEDIVLLRTSPTLFSAYDHVMDIMEQTLLPRFYRSPEFYQLISGAQHAGGVSKSTKKKAIAVAGWGKKLRAALRPSWLVDGGRLLGNAPSDAGEDSNYDTGVDLTEADFIADDSDTEQEATGAYADLIPVSGRDLTAWRISIPRVVTALDSAGKSIWAFEVDIQRIDLRPEDDPDEYHWTVARTYSEFYNLESKLVEFHGEFIDVRLPPKKMFGTGKMEFLVSVRREFELFLRTLLQQPALKGSDLIFSFLTLSDLSGCQAISDGSLMGSNLLPDLGLGRMMRTMPLKLRKERGQHLEEFLRTFIASTETPKPRPSKMEVRDLSANEVSVPVIKPLHPIFQDNAKSFLPDSDKVSRNSLPRTVNPVTLEGPYECLLYAAWKIWHFPKLVYSVMCGLRALLSVYFDFFVRKYVKSALARSLRPHKITQAITLLHETLLDGKRSTGGSEAERRRIAQQLIAEVIPTWMKKIFGAGPIESRCEMMFHCLQVPVFNKQLSYMLLDCLLDEIVPEIFADPQVDATMSRS